MGQDAEHFTSIEVFCIVTKRYVIIQYASYSMHHRLSESPFLFTGAFGRGLSAHSLPHGVTNEIGQMHCVVHDTGRSAD